MAAGLLQLPLSSASCLARSGSKPATSGHCFAARKRVTIHKAGDRPRGSPSNASCDSLESQRSASFLFGDSQSGSASSCSTSCEKTQKERSTCASSDAAELVSSRGTFRGNMSSWMGDLLPDSCCLSEVSMPGTHNSASFAIGGEHWLGAVTAAAGRCQSVRITTQLHRGIRFLDLRARGDGSLCHGVLDCGLELCDALKDCSDFLKQFPRETILVRLKCEEGGHEASLKLYRIVRSLATVMSLIYIKRTLPTLLEARGRVVILSDWHQEIQSMGLAWAGEDMDIQDEYWHSCSHQKWKVVRKHFRKKKGIGVAGEKPQLKISFASATALQWGTTPLDFARDVNRQLGRYLRESNRVCRAARHPGSLGIVVMDFPSELLCDLIVRRNCSTLDPCRPVCHLRRVGVALRSELLLLMSQVVTAGKAADEAASEGASEGGDARRSLRAACEELAGSLVRLTIARVSAEFEESLVDEPSRAQSSRKFLS
eukprot:TRINITY_DN25702_c0_g1_i1.p1 TRINITY_DN25702_c0_g1~~TRINITY_DN25702_c0_g1_i1.p1  ORF type:complete len:485 (+),score=74.66 TRINITY_DN25702_c0_g1_i1:52-1506(+)